MAYTAQSYRDMARYMGPLCRRRCVQDCSRTLSPVQMLATAAFLNHTKPLHKGTDNHARIYMSTAGVAISLWQGSITRAISLTREVR